MSDIQRDLGSLEARMDAHELRLVNIEEKIDRLIAFESQAKGGYRLLLGLGTITGLVASLATAAFLKLKGPG